MKKTKKELILEGFRKMDISLLEVLLDENRTYQGATKEVFLKKVEEAFAKFKNGHDHYLSSYEGFCNSQQCPNRECSGFSFVGSNYKARLDLIFEESDEDILDIFYCHTFKSVSPIETEGSLSIDIKEDEKVDFKPSMDFLIKVQKYNLAYEELAKYQNTTIGKEVYLPWLEKYRNLHESVPDSIFYSSFDDFRYLYSDIKHLAYFLSYHVTSKKAVEEYDTIDKGDEVHLLRWLVKYEKAGVKHDILYLFYLFNDKKKQIGCEDLEKIGYFRENILKIKTSDYKYIAKFSMLFYKNYFDKMEEYGGDEQEVGGDESLAHYLNKRGIKL